MSNRVGKLLKHVKINGKQVDDGKQIFLDHMIHLPQDMLKVGENVVEIEYIGLYRRDGIGLHRYKDPEDGEMYLYTLFESFSANKCFPCFDQPDIKATMQFYSFTPEKWAVISNEHEESVTKTKEVYTTMCQEIGNDSSVASRQDEVSLVFKKFCTTAKISTYLFAFVVGPYTFERNRLPGNENYTPMRIFARKSMMKYVDTEEFFKISMAGMDYYKDFFGCDYPFSKYDQLYVPEFNCGAMENVGCVTYTENYLDREDVVPMIKKNNRAITILHEMSHMWFGNLVTMKWWDDLWLNESFATFMSHICLSDAKGLENYHFSWDLFLKDKSWGLKTDSYSTTHPVAADVKDTEDAENIFDGISYGKGAGIMKQLLFFISEDTFRLGIQKYFAKYAFQNTQLIDLISTFQEACDEMDVKVDLHQWCDSWIKTSGYNILDSELSETGGQDSKIKSFKITQTLSEYGVNNLRQQNIQICFFNDKFEIDSVHDVTIDAESETVIDQLEGKSVPKAYLLNYMDWGYGKFLLDDKSLKAFKEGLSTIKDDLTRKIIYTALTDMTQDGKISASLFLEIVRSHIADESNQSVISSIINMSVPSFLSYYVPSKYQEAEADKMFDFLLNTLLPKLDNEELRQLCVNSLISVAATDKHYKFLQEWLVNKKPFYMKGGNKVDVGSKMSVSNKHSILKKISTSLTLNNAEFQTFVTQQLEEDKENKDLSGRCKLAIEAATYDKTIKNAFMDELLAPKSDRSIWEQRAIMSTLMPKSQSDIVLPLVDRFFDEIDIVFKNRLRDERDAIYFCLTPLNFASPELMEKFRRLVKRLNPGENKSLIAKLNEDIERLQRILNGQELYNKTIEQS